MEVIDLTGECEEVIDLTSECDEVIDLRGECDENDAQTDEYIRSSKDKFCKNAVTMTVEMLSHVRKVIDIANEETQVKIFLANSEIQKFFLQKLEEAREEINNFAIERGL